MSSEIPTPISNADVLTHAVRRAVRQKTGGAAEFEVVPGSMTLRRVQVSTSHSGPTPPMEYLEGYEALVPGSANRLLTMAEKSLDHRISIQEAESERANEETRERWKLANSGQKHGIRIAYFAIAASLVIALCSEGHASYAVPLAIMVPVFGYFIYAIMKGPDAEKPDPPPANETQ